MGEFAYDFAEWEKELGPEISSIGKRIGELTIEEIEAGRMRIGITALNRQLQRGMPRQEYDRIYDEIYFPYFGESERIQPE